MTDEALPLEAEDQDKDSASETLVSRAADEFLERIAQGERPDLDEFVGRYPEVAEVLRGVLPALQTLQQEPETHLPNVGEPPVAGGCLGDFRILREIGRGGMGIVYEAEQISLRRQVALKVLPFAAALDSRRLDRFRNEALAAARLHHSNIVPVYAVGCERGVYYYAMQMIEGLSLADVIGQLRRSSGGLSDLMRPVSKSTSLASNVLSGVLRSERPATTDARPAPTELRAASALSTVPADNVYEFCQTVARWGHQAACALDHAHGLDVVHRDIKPANLLLDARGNLWVTDFGLARLRGDGELTNTGDIVGTYRYMSPEQAQGKHGVVDHRTDLYSLGTTLYELLTLQPPFDGEGREEVLANVIGRDPVPPRRINRFVPADLETIVLKAMSKEPQERYATAGEFAEDLTRFLSNRPIRARRPSIAQRVNKWGRRHKPIVVASLVILVLALCGLIVSNVLIARERSRTREAYEEVAQRQKATAAALAEEERQRELAEQSFRKAREMLDTFVQACVEDLSDHEDDHDIRSKVLQASLGYYQGFIEQSRDNPPLQAELARSHVRVAKILDAIVSTPEARTALEQALETQERLVREHPGDEALRRGLFSMYFNLGVMRDGLSLMLIGDPAVQQHLTLTPEQLTQVGKFLEEQERQRRGGPPPQDTDFAKLRRQFRERTEAALATLRDILTESQHQRLEQIALQRQGIWALGDPEVADQLGLTANQRSLLYSIQEEAHRQRWSRDREQGKPIHERMQEVLTTAQKEAWQQMLGEPFQMPPRPSGRWPRPPGQPRSPDSRSPEARSSEPR